MPTLTGTRALFGLMLAMIVWYSLAWSQGTTLAVPPGQIIAVAPDHFRIDQPITTSSTKGLQEAIDMCPLTGCVIDLGPGDFTITKACSGWVRSENPGTGARLAGDNVVGGGAVLIANHRNLMIRGSGRQLTKINWTTEFSDTACGVASPGGVVASVFRVDSAPPPFETSDTVFRDLRIEIAQTNFGLTIGHTVGVSAIDIGPTGTIDVVEISNVYAECKQKAFTGTATASPGRCISIGTGGSNTQSHTPAGIDINHSFIESSGIGISQFNAERVGVWDNWLGTVNESGFGCSPELIYKRNGPMDVERNIFEFRGDSTLCNTAGTTTIRWMQLDARIGEGFPGTGVMIAGNTFIMGGSLWADLVFEGIYVTGYSYANIINNKFWCTRDFEDTDEAGRGDGNLDHCRMMVVQIDSTNTGANQICDPTTDGTSACNEGMSVIGNQFVGFMDNILNDNWIGSPTDDGCPIVIANPVDVADNQYGIYALNTFKIVDVNGVLDTGALANGFCGSAGTGYLKKNLIFGNSVIGKNTNCLAGDGITCGVEWDRPTQSVSLVITAYTVATLPAAAANTGKIVLVTDSAAGLCTAGGGAIPKLCRSNGAAWVNL